jgi:DNA-binding IclR family transcriptional regulator
MPASTVHRILSALEVEGLVRSDRDAGKYGVGLELFRLLWGATSRLPLASAALPVMQDLTAACGETSLLGVYDSQRKQLLYVSEVASLHPLRYVVPLYEWLPIHAGAAGLAILAYLPEHERVAVLQRPMPRITDSTITDRQRLEDDLAKIRRRGYSLTRGQRIPGAVGVAAPVLGSDGTPLGAIGVTLPEQRFTAGMEGELSRLVVGAAQEVGVSFGAPAVARGRVR